VGGGKKARRSASRWPNPVAVALASVATVAIAAYLAVPRPPDANRLRTRLTAAVQSLAQDAELAPGPAAQARTFGGTPAIGALFASTAFSSTGRRALGGHFCTASVVDSPHGDLVLTAAHCVSGIRPAQMVFVPAYHDGRAPYGVWSVTQVIVDHTWAASADPDDDVAFLVVTQRGGDDVARLTGADQLSFAEPYGQMVAVAGYPNDSDDPIRCQNQVRWFSPDQLQFDCAGYSVGTSGSPLLSEVSPSTGLGTVIGVIGGYEQGGDTSGVSYAARFGPNVSALYQAAKADS
jgi:V8-like Glu-specific endopeptidase